VTENTPEKKVRSREKKIYVVTINGETHFIRAKSVQTALKFAVSETVSVRISTQADTEAMARSIAAGGRILEA